MQGRMKTVICYFLSVFCCTACSLDIPYENQFSDPDAITTPHTARELLATAYNSLPNPDFELAVLGDDFVPTYLINRNANLNNLYKWQPQPIEDLSLSLWKDYYATIAIVNAVLERVDGISVTTEREKLQLQCIISEGKILKAYCYFNLLRLFAPDYGDGAEKDGIIFKDQFKLGFLKRSSIEECVKAIRTMLTEATEVDNNPAEIYWFSQISGYYLWAMLELYSRNYDQAIIYAGKVMEAKGGYDVLGESVYSKFWGNEACAERIFSLFTTNSYYKDINYDRNKGDHLTLNSALLNLYSEGDIRYERTVYPLEMAGETGGVVIANCLGKYNKMNWEKKEIQYIHKFRVAGACFILAEAYCKDGKEHDAQAIEVMNNYLAQRRATLVDTQLTGDQLLKAILQEKWKEFAGEGERYFDLKRYRKSILTGWNSNMKDKRVEKDDYRWTFPIPKAEYLYNENVSQNEGWTKIENN